MNLTARDGRWRGTGLFGAWLTTAMLVATAAIAQPPADPFELPAVEDGLPGEGKLRRYDGYVKGWRERRRAWSQRVAADRGGGGRQRFRMLPRPLTMRVENHFRRCAGHEIQGVYIVAVRGRK